MKNIIRTLILLISVVSFSQNFSGNIEYFRKISIKNDKEENTVKSDEDKAFQEAFEKASQKSYELSFNKNESLFEEIKQLEKPQTGSVMISISTGSDGKYYKNIKENYILQEIDMMSKEFLLQKEIEKFDWQISTETKKIGDYNCFKASLIILPTKNELEYYEKALKKYQENPKASIFEPSKPKEKTVIAWYTMEIPVSFGPEKFGGLPGLILELREGEFTYLATKVKIKTNETLTVKEPSKGKKIDKKEFDIEEEKMNKKMLENNGVFFNSNKD